MLYADNTAKLEELYLQWEQAAAAVEE